jgi:hypothetical protein
MSKMGVCKCKSKCVGSSRMCSGSRRRHGCAGAGAGKPTAGVAARVAAARRREAGAGQRGPGKRRRGCWVWQNRLNYSGSSALVIAIQTIITQRTSNETIRWSVGSPPDTTTIQQDRSRFTSHEGEFTITVQLINF